MLSLLCVPLLGQAQLRNKKVKFVEKLIPKQEIFLDYWVIPKSIRVFSGEDPILPDQWVFKPIEGVFLYRGRVDLSNVQIHYESQVTGLKTVYFKREAQRLSPNDTTNVADSTTVKIVSIQNADDLFGDVDLQRSGSLTRGITVGTNRDFSLESGLRFEMSGQLTDDVDLLVNLTDQSTPIQPDGSTQNLREFDQVYVRLRSPKATVQLGDVDISIQNSEFARINRRLQGVDAETRFGKYGNYGASVSVPRGQFRTQQFNGIDGLQGPYRLSGESGDQFITILAGTERVFIDGERIYRGENNDYIIDYGLGEITFTANRLITQATRITIDFEFITQEFNRTLITGQASTDSLFKGRLSLGVNYIREADSDDRLLANITEADIERLEQLGNAGGSALISAVEFLPAEQREDQILYVRGDTTLNGQGFTIFRFRPKEEEAAFRIRFGRFGQGNGPYRRVGQTENGIVFEWVGPGQGAYDTLRTVTPPIEQQMVAVRSTFKLTEGIRAGGEWAGSDFDANRFSSIGDEVNVDHAYLVHLSSKTRLGDVGEVGFNARQRFTGKRFAFFDRTRDIEFNRKWDINSSIQTEERISEASAFWSPMQRTKIEILGGRIERDDIDTDRQQIVISSSEKGLPTLNYTMEWINSSDTLNQRSGFWRRQRGAISQTYNWLGLGWTPKLALENEFRDQRNLQTDSLLNTSLRFTEWMPGLRVSLAEKLVVGADYRFRKEQGAIDGNIENQAVAFTQTYSLDWRPSSGFRTENKIGFRRRNVSTTFEERNDFDTDGVLIRSSSIWNSKKRVWSGQLLYEANTQRRAQLQETFIEVGTELGQFVWDDLNRDGIQQIDEFFPELTPNEGTFVKQFIPSDELIPIISLNFRVRNRIEPYRNIPKEATGFKGFLRLLAFQNQFELRENNTTSNLSDIYLLRLNKFRNAENTLQGRLFWRQEVEILPANPKHQFRLSTSQSLSLNNQTAGVEDQETIEQDVDWQTRVSKMVSIGGMARRRISSLQSENLASRNFNIRTIEVQPRVQLNVGRVLQNETRVTFADKTDRFSDPQVKASQIKVRNASNVFYSSKLQGNAMLEFRSIRLNGEPTATGIFELTDGGGIGSSWIWSLSGSYKVNNFIRSTFSYDGRTVQDRPTIHTVRVTVSAIF